MLLPYVSTTYLFTYKQQGFILNLHLNFYLKHNLFSLVNKSEFSRIFKKNPFSLWLASRDEKSAE
jgi:hypothetical protein